MPKNNKANKSGANSEAIVECALSILKNKNYPVVRQHKFSLHKLRDRPLASNEARVDFLIRCLPGFESGLIIEIKRQDNPGSTDQKLIYQIEKEIKQYYPYPSILIMIGKYWTDKWKMYALTHKGRWLVDVFFSYEELLLWCERLPVAIIEDDKIYKGLSSSVQPSLFQLNEKE